MGVFFCLLPSEPAASVLAELDRPRIDGVRWEPLERLHVTIRYFDSIPPGALMPVVDAAAKAAASLSTPTIELGPATERLGRDGTMVVPCAGAAPVARCLDEALDDAGLSDVLAVRAEPFYGHLTLARQRRGVAIPDAQLNRPVATSFVATSLKLINSVPAPDGRRYETLAAAPFGTNKGDAR